ncbi:MAG: disulfide bond formation protein DsbA [Hyphomicrobiales bacterium]|nr:MAG: disulfide bond formation protein DsbA [Hyphomicrobiales bacterium]
MNSKVQEPAGKSINLDVVSDVMCPWCYIGKRRLEKAISSLDDLQVNIRWRPFQLDPTLPAKGKDRRAYLEAKFGGPEKAKQIYANINEAGRNEGLDFNFDAIKVSSNTLDAHRIIRWASNEGTDVQNALVERLFQLYFMEGANIGNHQILIDAAKDTGMDAAVVGALLTTSEDREAVLEEIAVAQQMGVTGVPCFIIENKYAVMGAQEPEHIAEALRQAVSADDQNSA